MGLLDYLQKYGEPAIGLLSGAAAEPVAGWAGLLGGDVGKTREAMTYQPKTAQGMEGQQALIQALMSAKTAMVDNNPPVRMAVDGFNSLADRAGAASPALGALVKTLPAAAMSFGAPGAAPVRSAFANAGKESAKALAPKMGDALQNYMVKSGGILPMDVWHGSPHKFDKFDSGKIGTGEGAQAYGHGLYLAESPDVATMYRNTLSDADMLVGGRPFDNADPFHRAAMTMKEAKENGHKLSDVTDRIRRSASELKGRGLDWANQLADEQIGTLRALESGKIPEFTEVSKGSLYKVDLPDDKIAKMLDWDNPVSQQPWYKGTPSYDELIASVKSEGRKPTKQEVLLAKIKSPHTNLSDSMTGQQLYSNIGQDAVASANAAREYGFPGIRYLDGGSRGTGSGSSNFVVFPGNENILSILERNGMPIK